MLTYLPVRGLRSAHYSEFGGSNPPVSIGEHGFIGSVAQMVERSLCMRKVKGSMPFSSIL